jgi:hypothetical protein
MITRIDMVKRYFARRIASTLPLREGVSPATVLGEVWSAIERFWDNWERKESRYHIELIEHSLLLTPRRRKSVGRPEKVVMYGFIDDLVTIYERSTEKRITRNVNAYAPHGDAEKPHAFLAICIKAAQWGKIKEDDMEYPRLIVRQVLEKRHADTQSVTQ